MALSCSNLSINTNTCSVNYTASRDKCEPTAFVLHCIQNHTTESYLNFSKEQFLLGRDYYTDYPKSVHFLISDNAVIYQLVETYNRAWGISALDDPSWPLLNQCAWSDYEDMFIHIGFIGNDCNLTDAQLNAAAELMCCLIVDEGSQIDIGCSNNGIIVARDLDIKLDCLWDVPENLIAKTQVCVQNCGIDPYRFDDLVTLPARVRSLELEKASQITPQLNELEACCCANRSAIADLQSDLTTAQSELSDISIADLEQRLGALEEGNYAIWKAVRIVQDCLECANLCTPETPASISYRLDLTSTVKLVPGVLQHLNLPLKISDVNPPIVTTGPLWYAELTQEAQTLCNSFKIKGTARLSSANWCAGRSLELYAVVNSENILLNVYTAEAGQQAAYVFGETIFTVPPDSVVYLALKTDEDTAPLEVVMATVEIFCVDGLLSPNCVECDTV